MTRRQLLSVVLVVLVLLAGCSQEDAASINDTIDGSVITPAATTTPDTMTESSTTTPTTVKEQTTTTETQGQLTSHRLDGDGQACEALP